jgi:hypothetical protein
MNMNKYLTILTLGAVILLCGAGHVDLLAQSDSTDSEIRFHNAGSDIARRHTEELQSAQAGMAAVDKGEDILLVLNDGLYVQFADGSGRRKIIDKGTGYKAFMYPSWSLDGKKLAFGAIHDNARTADLVVANADGSNPRVILTVSSGLIIGLITSTSWSWDSQSIMFTYVYDNVVLGMSIFDIFAVHYTGNSPVRISGPDKNSCQFEPFRNSKRFAYSSFGTVNDRSSKLHVLNLDGSNHQIWQTAHLGAFKYLAWNTPTSIYAIVQFWDQFPNRDVLIRVDYNSGNPRYAVIGVSEENGELDALTLSPDRKQIYLNEKINNNWQLTLITLKPNGDFLRAENKGLGYDPNWRQQKPTTSVAEPAASAPQSFALHQNYPNPFNPETAIAFDLPWPAKVKLTVFDYLGREVATLAEAAMPAGKHHAVWNGKDKLGVPVAGGVYFYRLQAVSPTGKNTVLTRKMTLLK